MPEMPKQSHNVPSAGPGEFLSETRRKLGLEPENVAQILHLSSHQIEAIEANDFNSLPEPTYVRGYLRSYCQLLNIAPDSVLKSYNDAIGGWKTTTYSGLAAERQASSNDNIVRFATMGVIGVVFGLAIIWWLGEDETPEVMPAPIEIAAVPADESTDTPDIASVEAPVPEVAPASVVPAESAPAEKIEPVKPVARVKPVEALEPKPEDAEEVQSQTDASKTIKETAETIPTIASGVRAKLVLRTEGTSWADIRDANDNKLLYESVTAGRVITLEGEAPLQVFLGNANVVSLELDGKAYDFSRHKRGLTARFSVGTKVTAGSEE